MGLGGGRWKVTAAVEATPSGDNTTETQGRQRAHPATATMFLVMSTSMHVGKAPKPETPEEGEASLQRCDMERPAVLHGVSWRPTLEGLCH